ncbi:MAG: hypothetical protein OEY81_01320 [Candidatus Bathyarchaeota archaeon]|nr:hypothetical protein [Candidatus Bathyarchaeota archaeon]
MVKGTIRVGKLFSWSRNFDVDKDENVLRIIYYPNENTELHIQPSEESIAKLKAMRDEIKAIMARSVELEGTVMERWEKQIVTEEARQVEKWVKVEQ